MFYAISEDTMEFTGERCIPEKLKETDETYQEHIERYKFACGFVSNSIVLDAACGAGYGSYMLSETAKQVFGIDISQESIDYAREKYSNTNITFEVMNIEKLKYPDNFFDIVVSFETIEHISSQETFLKEIKRVLKPGGKLILSTPNIETTSKGKAVHTPFHLKEVTLDEMIGLLKDFKDIKVYSQKMTYHRRSYKKLRLLSRHINENFRSKIVAYIQNRYPSLEKTPILYRILLYEYAYKFKILPYNEKNLYIKPTFFIITTGV